MICGGWMMTEFELIKMVLTYFGVGVVLALTYLAGYRDCEKEREDE